MYLIIQYYNDKNPERQEEYDFCLEKNLNNPAITEIHNIIEKDTQIPAKFDKYTKLKNIKIDYSKTGSVPGRLTFKYVFDYVKEHIKCDEIICIANLDIFFDDSHEWLNIKSDFFDINDKNKVMCLSRYEYIDDKYNNLKSKIARYPYNTLEGNILKLHKTDNGNLDYVIDPRQFIGNSYDSWIFKNNLNEIKDCDFAVGNAPGCDGAIARRFYDSKYMVFNWMEKYKSFHFDLCRGWLNYITTEQTDWNGLSAVKRGECICPPRQDWSNILLNKIPPNYILK